MTWGPVAQLGHIVGAAALNQKMRVAGGDVGVARQNAFSVLRLLDLDAAQVVQPGGERFGERPWSQCAADSGKGSTWPAMRACYAATVDRG